MRIGLVTRSQIDYALDLANGLDAEGNLITLYMDHTKTIGETGDSDRPVERLYETGQLPGTSQVRLLRLPRMRDPRSYVFFRRLKRKMQEDGIDLLHILLNPGEIWFAILACFLTDIPVVTTMIVPVANTGERLPGSIIWAVNRIAAFGSDMVIVNGSDQVDLVKKVYGTPTDRIAYVPLSLYGRAVKWQGETISEEPGTILFFGRAHPHKGLEYLIKAQPLITQKVPYARILISAHGEDLHRCRQLIRDHSKFEIHEGFVSADVMAQFFLRASLVALPYISASTSGVLVTAHSFAKPVVASRVGCLAEYIQDGSTGILVEPSNVEDLANAIVRLLMDNEMRNRMGSIGRDSMREAQEFSINQTLGVYERAISIHSRDGSKLR